MVNHRHRRLLGMRGERPYNMAAEKPDEIASLHASSDEDRGKT
jgi:hypothetical protein